MPIEQDSMIDNLTKYTYKIILNVLSSKESNVDGINFTRSDILAIQKLDDGSELYVIHTKEREGKYIVNPRNFPDQDGPLSDHSPLITARSDETPFRCELPRISSYIWWMLNY